MGEAGTPVTISAGYEGLTKASQSDRCTLQRHESWLRRKSTCAQRAVHRSPRSDTAERSRTEHHRRQTQAGTHIPTEIVYEESPVGDINANGSIERANQTIQGQIRVIKDHTE